MPTHSGSKGAQLTQHGGGSAAATAVHRPVGRTHNPRPYVQLAISGGTAVERGPPAAQAAAWHETPQACAPPSLAPLLRRHVRNGRVVTGLGSGPGMRGGGPLQANKFMT